jgi:hypothetical protein
MSAETPWASSLAPGVAAQSVAESTKIKTMKKKKN